MERSHYDTAQPNITFDPSLTCEIYFDAGWTPETSLCEAVVLVERVAEYWRWKAQSSAPEAEMLTAIRAATIATQIAQLGTYRHFLIYGDNKQALGLLKTEEPKLLALAARCRDVALTIPNASWRHIRSPINPAGRAIKRIQTLRGQGKEPPDKIAFIHDGRESSWKVKFNSMVP